MTLTILFDRVLLNNFIQKVNNNIMDTENPDLNKAAKTVQELYSECLEKINNINSHLLSDSLFWKIEYVTLVNKLETLTDSITDNTQFTSLLNTARTQSDNAIASISNTPANVSV